MALRLACLAAKEWPTVIAEIIAAYAARTLEESVALLVGPQGSDGDYITRGTRLTIWWSSAYDGCLTFLFGMSGTSACGVSPYIIAESVRMRKWQYPQSCDLARRVGSNRGMLAGEVDALVEWLATA